MFRKLGRVVLVILGIGLGLSQPAHAGGRRQWESLSAQEKLDAVTSRRVIEVREVSALGRLGRVAYGVAEGAVMSGTLEVFLIGEGIIFTGERLGLFQTHFSPLGIWGAAWLDAGANIGSGIIGERAVAAQTPPDAGYLEETMNTLVLGSLVTSVAEDAIVENLMHLNGPGDVGCDP